MDKFNHFGIKYDISKDYVSLDLFGDMGVDDDYYVNLAKASRCLTEVVSGVISERRYEDFKWDVQNLRNARKDLVELIEDQSEIMATHGVTVSLVRPKSKKENVFNKMGFSFIQRFYDSYSFNDYIDRKESEYFRKI